MGDNCNITGNVTLTGAAPATPTPEKPTPEEVKREAMALVQVLRWLWSVRKVMTLRDWFALAGVLAPVLWAGHAALMKWGHNQIASRLTPIAAEQVAIAMSPFSNRLDRAESDAHEAVTAAEDSHRMVADFIVFKSNATAQVFQRINSIEGDVTTLKAEVETLAKDHQ